MRAVAPNFFPSSAGYADIGCSVKYMRCIALVSPLDPERLLAVGSGFGQESAHEGGRLSRLLHFDAVARAFDDLEARARQQLRIALTAFQRDDPVIPSPDDEGRRGETPEKMWERLV